MNMKHERLIAMGRYESYTSNELIKHLDEVLEKVPEAARATAMFEITEHSEPYSDEIFTNLTCTYQRPPTEKEVLDDAERLRVKEERQRKEYLWLAVKFGPKA
jgi:hypothetical protein